MSLDELYVARLKQQVSTYKKIKDYAASHGIAVSIPDFAIIQSLAFCDRDKVMRSMKHELAAGKKEKKMRDKKVVTAVVVTDVLPEGETKKDVTFAEPPQQATQSASSNNAV